MQADRRGVFLATSVALADSFIRASRAAASAVDLARLMEEITLELGFRHFALIHHADLRGTPTDRVDIRDYPEAAVMRIIGEAKFRRDPVIRACAFAECAFLWSEIDRIITLDRNDRNCLEAGRNEGLIEPNWWSARC